MGLPSNISFGTFKGNIMRAVADGADSDRNPDGIPMAGLTVKFIPSVEQFKNVTAVPPRMIIADSITATTNSEGFIVGDDGEQGVRLLATDDEDLQPTGWTWGVAISGPGFRTISFSFALPADDGTLENATDLATVVRVPSSPGGALADWVAAVNATQAFAGEATTAAAIAVDAAGRAEAVPPQVDGVMKVVLDDPASEFTVQLNANIVQEVEAVTPGILAADPTIAAAFADAAETQLPPLAEVAVADAIAAYPAASMHAARKADLKRRKGGVIGTSGKPVIAFQIAHQLDMFKSLIWPEFKSRGIPVGWGAVTRAVGQPDDPYEPTVATWDDVRKHFYEGAEVWSHSRTHLEPLPAVALDPRGNGDTIKGEIQGSREDIEAQNLYAVGWQTAGVYPSPVTPYYEDFVGPTVEDMNGWASPVGQELLANYGLINFNAAGGKRILPTDGSVGLGFWNMDRTTFTVTKAQIDSILDRPGQGLLLALHPKEIGGATGGMTFAHFIEVLDYVKSLWDADQVEVLTQSGLAFADPSRTGKFDILSDNSMDGASIAANWVLYGGAQRLSDGGHTGTNYVRLPSASGAYTNQSPGSNLRTWGLHGQTLMFEGWARNVHTTGTSGARVQMIANTPGGNITLRDVTTTLQPGSGWQRIRFPFGIPKDATNVIVQLMRSGIGVVDWDDAHGYIC